MADYTKTTWVDDDGSGTTGTDFTAARMNNIEVGIADAIAHNRIGALSTRPAAAAGNKNWLWIATDTDGTGGLYLSDGSTWTKMPVGSLPNDVKFGQGGWLNSFAQAYTMYSSNYNSAIDRLFDTTRPAYIFELDARSGFDRFTLRRTAPTTGAPAWVQLLTVDPSGVAAAGDVKFGVGGAARSSAVDNTVLYSNYNPTTDRLIDTSKPGWLMALGATVDECLLYRAPATAGAPAWVNLVELKNNGSMVGGNPPWVTALPTTGPSGGALQDGQECYYLADAATGTVWHLKYRAAEAGSFKWYYVGGSPLLKTVDAVQSTSSLTYVDLTTAGPSITVPLAGDYEMEMSAVCAGTGGANRCFVTPKKNAAAVNDADGSEVSVAGGSTNTGNAFRRKKLTGLAANDVFKLQYANLNATAVDYGYRSLQMTPIRVG
jgi:hypothetical protein